MYVLRITNSFRSIQQIKGKASVPVTVPSQIFIVTKDRENIKLAFAKVAAIHEKEMLEHIKKKHGDSIEQREHLKSKLEAAIQEEEAADTDKEVLRIDWLSDSSKTNYENYLAAKETLFQKNRSKLDIQKKLIKLTSPYLICKICLLQLTPAKQTLTVISPSLFLRASTLLLQLLTELYLKILSNIIGWCE